MKRKQTHPCLVLVALAFCAWVVIVFFAIAIHAAVW